MSSVLARSPISEERHRRFAELSGDLNPLHVDREASRLMPPGRRLAYGMDLLLWGLDTLARKGRLPESLARVRVRFPKWVFLEDDVQLKQTSNPSGHAYELVVNGAIVATFDLHAGERMSAPSIDCSRLPQSRRTVPLRLLLEELEGREASVRVADAAGSASLFPELSKTFGAQLVSECATCSYIIGMEAPGLYSMSMKYDLQFHAEPRPLPCMRYKVVGVDERFRKIRIAVTGGAVSATLEALVREP